MHETTGDESRVNSCSRRTESGVSVTPLGDVLLELLGGATREALLVAPFIKVGALARVLEGIAPSVAVTCVTRWRLEELATGVSDLDVWPLVHERGGAVYLRPDLHAKYYRADEHCLVGSANLTGAALGWVRDANLELLVGLPATDGRLCGWERNLLAGTVAVDEDLYQAARAALAAFPPATTRPGLAQLLPVGQSMAVSFPAWLPRTRQPADLFRAYTGRWELLSAATRAAAAFDLAALDVVTNLPQAAFERAIGVRLLQHPLLRRLDAFVGQPRRFGEVVVFLRSEPTLASIDHVAAWQTSMRWLLHFLPSRYRLAQPRHTEMFWRVSPGESTAGS